jgi:Tfp pilus assembly protein PilF
MSRTLKLVDRLLAMGRNYLNRGRDQEALHVFGRVAGLRKLPKEAAEEAQARLAEIYLRRKNYRRARRHLTAALAHAPENPHYHYLMANAANDEDRPNLPRAAEHFRRSLDLDPSQPRCLGDFGLLSLQMGKIEEGMNCLRRAVELAPNDPEAVQNLVFGLLDVEEPDEARRVLQAALFRNSRDPRFRKLWSDFQFQQLWEDQKKAQWWEPVVGHNNEPPHVLPFNRGPAEPANAEKKRVRHDGASPTQPPHLPRFLDLPDKKHA